MLPEAKDPKDSSSMEGYILIEVRNLTKRYGQHIAVDNISFTVSAGEIVGFLGPNGAGKTTTMNIMTGYIAATEGDVSINGMDIIAEPERAKANIGYLPDTPPVYGEMRVDEYLNFVADIKRVKPSARTSMIAGIKRDVRIEDMSRRLIKNLSRGYRQRVGLAQAMVGNPRVIIMDEPTIGLDPKQIIEMRDVIRKLGSKHTVILSSHILQEVSAVCDRIMIINKGRIVASDTPARLSAGLSRDKRMQVRVKGEKQQVLSALADYPIIKSVEANTSSEPGAVDLILSGTTNQKDSSWDTLNEKSGEFFIDIREAVFQCMAKNNLPILMMKSMELTLEEIFLRIVSGNEEYLDTEDDYFDEYISDNDNRESDGDAANKETDDSNNGEEDVE